MGTDSGKRILQKMLDRLLAALANGPSLNARPHNSRQRLDLTALSRLQDRRPEQILRDLLGDVHMAKVVARASPPREKTTDDEGKLTPEAVAALRAWSDQANALTKLRSIAEDARDYENDTGVHVLYIGFPLLSLPPGSIPQKGFARRVLAPVAFIAVNLAVRHGTSAGITLECRNEDADLIIPNIACLTWLSRLSGTPLRELDEDERGKKPWDELAQITAEVCRMVNIAIPPQFASGTALQEGLKLEPAPRADEEEDSARIVPAAVLGLYPMANQGLIRDTQALIDGEEYHGPIESFLKIDVSLEAAEPAAADGQANLKVLRKMDEERLVAPADPCQARAVMLARSSRGLVVHGPPGTGKSQTITNIIGDHLARGERVLFVCDKRTALDVVMNRLQAMGLGDLCAIVHDPRRDQRELYRSIREQLENLSTARSDLAAEAELARVDRELAALHGELTNVHIALMRRPDRASVSFHELVGQWLSFGAAPVQIPRKLLGALTLEQVEHNSALLMAMLQRAADCGYLTSPWRAAAGISLEDFLATPMAEIRQEMAEIAASAQAADAIPLPKDLCYPPATAFDHVARDRTAVCELLAKLCTATTAQTIAQWTQLSAGELAQRQQEMQLIQQQAALIGTTPVDLELSIAIAPPPMDELLHRISDLEAYLLIASSLLGIFAFGRKRAAAAAIRPSGLPLNAANAKRVLDFYKAMRLRLGIVEAFRRGAGWTADTRPADAALLQQAQLMQDLIALRQLTLSDPSIAGAICAATDHAGLIDRLRSSAQRAQLLYALFTTARSSRLLASAFLDQAELAARRGGSPGATFLPLQNELRHLESVLRTAHDQGRLPDELKGAARFLLEQSCIPEEALASLRREVVAVAISARLKASPQLQSLDSTQLDRMLHRYVELEATKRTLSRTAVRHQWTERQRQRLLASTGTRLNGAGADLRRRLTLQGANAMRLRQVIGAGAQTEGGDPLFDLRPIWMASPETVAEIFPRQSMFDVAIFDEASQCRLEEALPILLRADRVVIAGDPKQLPPSRFFETAIATSEEQEIESDQQLFEARQGEVEDLLAAALNLEIEEAYLDVHYRSRNSDLIEFSNQHFYSSRLQPIPGHPANRLRYAPLTLYHVGGTYEDRSNVTEAKKVCQIVRDLLRRAEKPSIGIACFNLQQRDLILDTLEELAEQDREFGRDLAEARTRRHNGMFEGLFVRNLENVQGDERDHIIISTTYGADPQGRFYKRFGPLGRTGGGRRLNVLITRAREEVHLVSSIPQSVYRNPPTPEEGQSAGGPLLLFYYLAYAEQLAEIYEHAHQQLAARNGTVPQDVRIQPSRYPSDVARHLGQQLLSASNIGSYVHWGNDGFCIDLALQHPRSAEDVTIGILCDLTRFEAAADLVEWEIFRTVILESQGWKLHRLWTPHYFRDPEGALQSITEESQRHTRAADERDSLRVI